MKTFIIPQYETTPQISAWVENYSRQRDMAVLECKQGKITLEEMNLRIKNAWNN